MTKRLILVRHAKSSWDDPALDDHGRPLTKRGRLSAKAIGDWLRGGNYVPDQTLSSNSARTRETAELLGFKDRKSFVETLYHASSGQMLRVLQGAEGQCVLLLGHNPGMANFAMDLVDEPPEHSRFADYPTCATLVVDFPISDWSQLTHHSGKVLAFITPRELTE